MQKEDVLKHITKEAVVELTREMIRVPTVNPPGNEVVLAELLQERMSDFALDAKVLPLESARANLICRIPGSGEQSSLIFSGHLDTVAFGTGKWDVHPLSADLSGGKIFGRGACDMKGGVAAMIIAARALRESGIPLRGDLILAFTAGEEVDSIGASSLVEQGLLLGAGGLIVAEPTNLNICVAEKGALWLEATTRGLSAHGSTPHLGRNAILPMAEFIVGLEKLLHVYLHHPLLGGHTMNVGTIEGGFKTNVVPDLCRVTVDFRTVPGQDHSGILKMVGELLREASEKAKVEWDVRVLSDRKPIDTPTNSPFVKLFAEIATEVLGGKPAIKGVSYFTDGAVLVPALKVPMVICGPGDPVCAHQVNEWVDVDKLYDASRIYALLAARILGGGSNGVV